MTGKRLGQFVSFLVAAGLGCAMGVAPAAAQQVRPVSLMNSFPIGSNGLCEAQIMEPQPGAGLFDRGYTVICRDAAAPVGTLWVVRDGAGGDPVARFLPAPADCTAANEALAPEALGNGRTLSCQERGQGVNRLLAFGEIDGRTYAGQSVAAYKDVVRLGLETLASDRLVAGTVDIPLTETGDAAAFARSQARAISANAALAEAYRRSNAGSFAAASEFFAQSADSLSGAVADEALLNEALQQSNLGNYAESERLFGRVRGRAMSDPVLGRMLRNYEAIDALNAGDPAFALRLLALPLAPGARFETDGAEISAALAERLAAEQPDALAGTESLTPSERAELLDGQADYLRATAHRLLGDTGLAAAALQAADTRLVGVRDGRVISILWLRAQVLGELADLRELAGDPAGAEGLHRQSIVMLETNYPGSPALLSARAQLGGFYARMGRSEEALTIYRAVAENADSKPAASLRRLLVPYFDLLAGAQGGGASAAGDMFYASQLLQRPGLAQTQAVLARELSGGSDEAAQMFRQAVNLGRAIEQSRNAVAQLEAQADAGPLVLESLAQRRAELESLQARQLAVQDQLGAYPKYRVVSDGRLKLADLQAALHEGEGYLKLAALDGATYAIFATRGDARAYRIETSPAEIEETVDAIRNSIAVAVGGQTQTAPFDTARARQLYVALLGPIDGELRALDHLVLEPDGAMLRLPANLLVTDDASVARYAERSTSNRAAAYDFSGTAWLGRKLKISTTVAPAAFRDVRASPASAAANDYLGFGENAPLSATPGAAATRSALAGGSDCLWAPAVWNYPIEADELRTAAASLTGAPGQERIVTGRAFTDTAVLGMEDIDQYRILHFATHGLVTAPQPECPPRPALLTSFGAEGSDGLLSFAEIFDLDLDADLVILSACDTAGQATVGATREAGVTSGGGYALDGLVRAFVGAGGRSVIASHWPVPDTYDATDRLIGGFFRAPNGASIAEALRGSQLALMDQPDTSHPFYWAAFAIIGDGAATLRR